MKYKITPLNVFALLLGLFIAWYFIHPHSDPEGWGEFFFLYYGIPFCAALFIIDLIIQLVLKTKRYRWIVVVEGPILLVIALVFMLLFK